MNALPHLRSIILFFFSLLLMQEPTYADITRELKRLTGYSIIYGGSITETSQRNYSEKVIKLDNGWVFKLDCLMLMPLALTDVVVLGKRFPDSALQKYPNLPTQMQYQFKLIIDRDVSMHR